MLMASSLPDSRKWVWGNSRGSHMWCWFFGGCDMAAGGWGSLYAKRGNKFCQMSPRATDSETRLLPSTQEFPVSKHGNSKRKSCGAVWSFSMSWNVYLMNVLETHTHTHAACVKIVGKAKWWQMTHGSVVRVTRCPSCPDLWGAAGCLTSKRDNQGSSGRGDTHGWQKRSSTTPASPQSSSIFNIFLQKTSFKSSFTVSKLSTQVTFSAVLNTGQLKITPKRLYQHMGLT